jgi:FSR family fosmidomycin resistance protein-like MFS transporter
MTLPRSRLFWSVSFGHLIIDMFNGMGPVLLAFLSGHMLAMTNTQIGFAISAYQLAGAVSQPFFGWLADRNGGRLIGAGGVTWTVGFLMLSMLGATTGSYLFMLIPFVLAALGSGAFHPVGTMHAAEAERTRAVSNLSIFFLMGQFGGGLGPAVIGVLLDSAATHNNDFFTAALGPAFYGILGERGSISPVLALGMIAIPAVIGMFFTMPSTREYIASRIERLSHAGPAELSRRALLVLVALVTLRSLANPGSVSFLPRMFQLQGWSATEYGLVTSMFWFAGGFAGVFFSQIAERTGMRIVIVTTMVAASVPIFLLPIINGPLVFLLSLAAGALTGGSHTLIVAMSQRMLPKRKGLASGASLGFIFGTGALGTLVIGAVSDQIGLTLTFQVVGVITLLTGLLALALPDDRRQRPAQPEIERAPEGSTVPEPAEVTA